MTLLSFFCFWSSTCASCVLDSKFKLCAFVLPLYSSRERLRIQVVSALVWLWWVIDLPLFEFESGKFRWFYLYLSHVKNHVCLSCGVQVTSATWRTSMRIMAGVGDLVQRIEDDQAQVKYSVAEQSRDRVTLCAVCTVHKETRSASFLVWSQNQGRQFLPI
jgi:hypothetical protein